MRGGHVIRSLIVTSVVLALTACATPGMRATTNEERTAAWFEGHRDRPPMLRMFLQQMPKGGDIHSHLTGAIYAESYIAWAAAAAQPDLCADETTRTITPCCPPACKTRPVADALRDTAFYNALVDGLSTRNLANHRQSGHDQFFAAFRRFSSATDGRSADMVAEVAGRAADQHVMYLETMLTFRGEDVRELGKHVPLDPTDLSSSRQRLLDAGLRDLVKPAIRELDELEGAVSGILDCGRDAPPSACRVTRRYLQQTTRVHDPQVVFARLVFAFELAQADRRVAGLNLVAPEDYPVARRDYSLQMKMVGYLADQYPAVNVALHAGELTLGLVPPADLRFHIREAVEVAKAKRIGHGVAIAYERDALQLMAAMRQRQVLVEICLTSNDVVLGVKGARHPFVDYLKAGVPVTLATDDEGVSRIDLTNEYLRAAETYGLGYRDLKQLARNSLTYSFLPGQSLWNLGANPEPIPVCAGERAGGQPAPHCQAFLAASEKARMQWELERAFDQFEAMAW
jgi:Adenosine deaminase